MDVMKTVRALRAEGAVEVEVAGDGVSVRARWDGPPRASQAVADVAPAPVAAPSKADESEAADELTYWSA